MVDSKFPDAIISVVLPTYNESESIGMLLESFSKTKLREKAKLIIVDDSPSLSTAVAASEGLLKNGLSGEVMHRTYGGGLVSAISYGLENSESSYVGWMDADGSMPPRVMEKMLEKCLEEGWDIVVASRFAPGGKRKPLRYSWRNSKGAAVSSRDSSLGILLSWLINFFARRLLGSEIRDYTSGFIVARRSAILRHRLRGSYGEYCISLLHEAKLGGARITEFPYDNLPRLQGESKTADSLWGYLVRGIPYVLEVIDLRLKRR
jgi:dolichol-phosphate mannosyltransferase